MTPATPSCMSSPSNCQHFSATGLIAHTGPSAPSAIKPLTCRHRRSTGRRETAAPGCTCLLRGYRAVVVDQAAGGGGLLARIDLRNDPLAGPQRDSGDLD